MDIMVKTQATGAINIVVSMALNTGAPDTAAANTITCIAFKPDGTEATFTAPTITELGTDVGLFLLAFPADAATKLFTLTNELNPYTICVKGTTAGGTQYRTIRAYCVDRLPGEVAKSTEIAAIDVLIDAIIVTVDAIPTLAEIESAATIAAIPTLAEIEASAVLAKSATVATAANLAALQVTADAVPTLAEIEASTILAKEATSVLLKKFIKNKKIITAAGSVYSLVIYDDNDIDEILRKVIKDVAGADITAVGAGVIAREMKSSV